MFRKKRKDMDHIRNHFWMSWEYGADRSSCILNILSDCGCYVWIKIGETRFGVSRETNVSRKLLDKFVIYKMRFSRITIRTRTHDLHILSSKNLIEL